MTSASPSPIETEHRLTKLEVGTASHEGRISYLEKAVHGCIYAIAALATSKSGDVVEVLLSILKAKL